jgi:hypothetical protein
MRAARSCESETATSTAAPRVGCAAAANQRRKISSLRPQRLHRIRCIQSEARFAAPIAVRWWTFSTDHRSCSKILRRTGCWQPLLLDVVGCSSNDGVSDNTRAAEPRRAAEPESAVARRAVVTAPSRGVRRVRAKRELAGAVALVDPAWEGRSQRADRARALAAARRAQEEVRARALLRGVHREQAREVALASAVAGALSAATQARTAKAAWEPVDRSRAAAAAAGRTSA